MVDDYFCSVYVCCMVDLYYNCVLEFVVDIFYVGMLVDVYGFVMKVFCICGFMVCVDVKLFEDGNIVEVIVVDLKVCVLG